MNRTDILWLVTARSGSKSVPDKNIKLLGSLPLMAYKIQAAQKMSGSDTVWLSTDSTEYAEIGKKYGATIPFIRPRHLASDDASSVDVVLHAMEYAEKKTMKKKFIGLLEPTSPFVYPDIIEEAITQLMLDHQAHAIVATREVRPHPIFVQDDTRYLSTLAKNILDLKKTNRQVFQKQVTPSGGFYISRWNAFKKFKTFYTPFTISHPVPVECELEIDEALDWKWAEFLLKEKIVDLKRLLE